jgi:RNA polymerase sigma-70 factor, ECF subfamily
MTRHDSASRACVEHLNELLRQVSCQDRRAFAELHALTKAKLRKTAVAISGVSPDVDDILQDAYLKIWRHAKTFDPGRSSPITWMCTILRNTAIDAARLRKPPQVADIEEALSVPAPTTCAQDDDFDFESASPAAFEALGRLPENRRRLLELAYLAGESRATLSRRFGVPVGTVKTWLRRTAEAVRKDCLRAVPSLASVAA